MLPTSENAYPLRRWVNRGEVEADDRTGVPASFRCALRGSRLRRVRLSFGARRTAEDLDGHPKVAQGVEVGDVNPAVLTAEHHAVLALCPRKGLVEVRGGDGDVVHALALLGEEAGIDAFLVERLYKLPHHPADRGDRAALRRADARPAAGPAPRPRSAASSRSRSASPTSGSRRSGPCRRRANAPPPPTRPVA